MKQGVYIIRNVVTRRIYLGSSADIPRRWSMHRHALSRGKHHSPKLQNSWNKHGADVFEFIVLEYVIGDQTLLRTREQKYLDRLRPSYNISTTAHNPTISVQGRERLAASLRSRMDKPEFKQAHKASMASAQTSANCSAAFTGRVMSQSTRDKHRQNALKQWANRQVSPEAFESTSPSGGTSRT